MTQNMKLMKNCRVSISRKILRHVILTHFKAGAFQFLLKVSLSNVQQAAAQFPSLPTLSIFILMIAVNDVDVIFPLVTDMYLVQRSQFPVSQKTENSWWKGRQS